MPKMKTHSGAKKRFRTSGSGKVMHRRAGKAHLNEHKSSRRLRRADAVDTLEAGDAKKVKRLLRK
jgi:large subunit ribosomal protein L35